MNNRSTVLVADFKSGVTKMRAKSDWFEIYQLNPSTYAILEPYHKEEVICYLIIGKDMAVLFDSGMGIADIHAEVSAITNLPVIVINSHSHYDHIGGNHQFKEVWSFKNKFENDRIEKGYSNAECRQYMTEGSYSNLPADVDLQTFSIQGVRVTKYLQEREVIDLGGRRLTVHRTPGETPGAISLYDDQYKIFFTGDLLHPGGMWLYQEESEWSAFCQSVKHLSSHIKNLEFICPAHNEFCVSPEFITKVQQAIQAVNNNVVKGKMKENFLAFEFDGFSFYLPKTFSTAWSV
jgi:glyoxylase-like metal-dependent hydrolase (beta-lactamase superfamily II)